MNTGQNKHQRTGEKAINLTLLLKMKTAAPQLPVTKYFQQFIQASVTGRRSSATGKRISKGTITNYRYVLRLLYEYETHYGTTLRIQLLHRAPMRLLQKEKNYWTRFFKQFSRFLYKDKKYFDHYIHNVCKMLKTFFNWLQKEKGFVTGNYHHFFRIPVQEAVPVVLLPEQLRFLIINEDFENSLSKSLKRARDIFVFGCTAGLRYADLMKLKKTHLQTTEGETRLVLYTQKTGAAVSLPLPGYALVIAERYKRKAGQFILPRLSCTNLNIQVKKLALLAGWDQPMPKMRSLGGRMTEIKNKKGGCWKFYEHITAHTMRRTAITSLLMLGVPETIVRKISGHAAGSKEFYKYVVIAQEYLNREVIEAHKKLVDTSYTSTTP